MSPHPLAHTLTHLLKPQNTFLHIGCDRSFLFRYLVGQLSEAEGSLDGCSKTCSRQAEYVSKLTFEIEETDKKLVLEAERLERLARVFEVSCLIIRLTLRVRLAADYDQLKGSIAQNKQEHRHARTFASFSCAIVTPCQRQPSALELSGQSGS
jgi:hypothetical protein